MLSATLVGYVFQAVETRTHNDKTFHAMKLKLSQNKNSYIYVDCFVNDGILKYASTIEKDSTVLIFGDLSVSAYTNKQGEPCPKVHCQVKSIKLIAKAHPKEKEMEQEIPW